MPQVETIAVVCPWDASLGKVLINLTDFNSSIHTRWEDKDLPPPDDGPGDIGFVEDEEPAGEDVVVEYQAGPPLNENGLVEVRDTTRRGRRAKVQITADEWASDDAGRYELWVETEPA